MSDKLAKTVSELTAVIISTQQAAYSGWVAAGAGAGFALLAGNAEKLVTQVGLPFFHAAGVMLIASFVVHARVRYLAMKIAVSKEISAEIGKVEIGEDFDSEALKNGLVSRSRWPFSSLLRRALSANAEPATRMIQTAQTQTLVLWLQLFLVASAAASLLLGTWVGD